MAVATKAIVEGQVVSVNVRKGVSKRTSEKYEMIEVLIIGENTLANCTLGQGVNAPEVGAKVRGRVVISVYGQEDQTKLEAWL